MRSNGESSRHPASPSRERTSRSFRVLIQKHPTGFETKLISPPHVKDLPSLITSDSVLLWSRIRTWLEDYYVREGLRVDWIYAQFHPEYGSGFPNCATCGGSGLRPKKIRKESNICTECHGIKVALPGFND